MSLDFINIKVINPKINLKIYTNKYIIKKYSKY